jgi:stage V sporulation protein R
MESFINPEEYLEEQKKKIEPPSRRRSDGFRRARSGTCWQFLLDHAPLERWERDILEIVRDEAYYFQPQMQTKIMNEGWATYWHSKIMTEKVARDSEIIDYADNAAAVLATSKGRLNPYKLGVELFKNIEERWNKGQFGKEWEECDDLEAKKSWDLRLGLGRKSSSRCVRSTRTSPSSTSFSRRSSARENKLYTFGWSTTATSATRSTDARV